MAVFQVVHLVGIWDRVAISAWGHYVDCDNASDTALDVAKAWVAQFAGKGPEGNIPG